MSLTLYITKTKTCYVVEGTFGFWIRPYNTPSGKLEFGLENPYVDRDAGRERSVLYAEPTT